MPADILLALDQGTTSTRAIAFDLTGQAVADASRPLQQHYPDDGWVEHDPDEIIAASRAVIQDVLAELGAPLSRIVIGITNQRETVVVWDRTSGRPVYPAIVWQDRRTEDCCAALRDAGAEHRVSAVTGLRLDPYFSATKIAWILDHVPGARDQARAGALLAGTIDSWLIWTLTGGRVHATDATNASRTSLFDIGAQVWSAEMAGLFDVPLSLMPRVLDCADDFGSTDPALFGSALPIRGVAGDQQAALMGQGCLRPGEMKATFGTGCFMLLHTGDERAISGARLLTTVAARVRGQSTYALEGSIFVAGAAIQWLNEALGVAGGPKGAEALAQQARAGHGVVVVPAFTGLGAPWWDAAARGTMFGLTRDSGLAEIAAATFDACALQTRDLIDAMRSDAPAAFGAKAELRIDGGMSQSRWFAQRLADLTGVPVLRAAYQETTALGAALFAGLGAGVFPNLEASAMARPGGERLTPQLGPADRDAHYKQWLFYIERVKNATMG